MGVRAIVAALLLGALGGACVGMQTKQRRPLKSSFDTAKRDAIWQSAILTLQEQNYPIQLLDQASGTISTGEVSGFTASCNDGSSECQARETVSMTVSPTGTMLVNVNRSVYYMGLPGMSAPRWDGITFAKDVAAVEARQKELADIILARVAKVDETAAVMRGLEPSPASAPTPDAAPESTP